MPTRKEKQKMLEKLEEKLKSQKFLILFDFLRMKAKDFSDLRKKIKNFEAEIIVVKKKLAKISFSKFKIPFDFGNFKGKMAILLGSQDILGPLKSIWKEKEKGNLEVLAVYVENNQLDPESIKFVSQFEKKEEIFQNLIFNLSFLIQKLIFTLKFGVQNLIFLLEKIKGQKAS
jgi:large subunit ribosomal protein L10